MYTNPVARLRRTPSTTAARAGALALLEPEQVDLEDLGHARTLLLPQRPEEGRPEEGAQLRSHVPEVVLDVVEVVATDRVDGEARAVAAPPGAIPPCAGDAGEDHAEGVARRRPAQGPRRPGPARRSGPRRPSRPGPSSRSTGRPRPASLEPAPRRRGGRRGRGTRTRAATRSPRRAAGGRRVPRGSPPPGAEVAAIRPARASRSTPAVSKPHSGHTRSSTQVQSLSSGTIGIRRT